MKGDISRDTFDAKKHYSGVVMQQGRVQLDADWNEQQNIHRHRAETAAKDIVGASGAPLHDAGFSLTPAGKSVVIGKGRYYVDGLLCENEAEIDYLQQPDYPGAPQLADIIADAGATALIFYLCVWRRGVTALEDPSIREVALGGADTAARVKTIWQVKALPVKVSNAGGGIACGDGFDEWNALIAPATGRMSARAQPVQPTDNPCLLPPGAGYRSLENQLYRVEVHKAGPLATATFKWSRDNGAIVTAVEKFSGSELTVHDLGRDETRGFANGQWVELLDDATELAGKSGPLLQIDHVDEAARLVVLKSAPAAVDLALRPKLRRWDGAGEITVAPPAGGSGWTPLEEGVEVKFEPGDYRVGDFWLIPARTVTGSVEWPFATPQPPRGDRVHYSRIAVASVSGGAVVGLQDCRKLFAPLSETPPALHITATSWVNDGVLTQEQLQGGLKIFFDAAPTLPPAPPGPPQAPATLGAAPMTVTLEAPLPVLAASLNAAAVTAQVDLVLGGDLVAATPNALQWSPVANGGELGNIAAYLVAQRINMVRLRVRLLGSSIWRDTDVARLYLDGRALGVPGLRGDGATPRVDLQFPSGDARRSSDFESWFYLQLQVPPAALAGVSLSASVVNAGDGAQGTVFLDHPAPAEGFAVALSSSSPVVGVPANVPVPAGQTQANFNLTTNPSAAQNTLDVLISATARGATQTAPLRVQVVRVAVSPLEVTVFLGHGQQFSATVTGADDKGVNWSVQEAGGGSTNTTGLYIAPQTVGDFHLVAASTANPQAKAFAIIHVRQKSKDKEKEKEKDKEKEKEKESREKLSEKIIRENVRKINFEVKQNEFISIDLAATEAPFAHGFEPGDEAAPGRSFIRPSERPDLTPRAGH